MRLDSANRLDTVLERHRTSIGIWKLQEKQNNVAIFAFLRFLPIHHEHFFLGDVSIYIEKNVSHVKQRVVNMQTLFIVKLRYLKAKM